MAIEFVRFFVFHASLVARKESGGWMAAWQASDVQEKKSLAQVCIF